MRLCSAATVAGTFLLFALSSFATATARGEDAAPTREPWTRSRIHGTPEPPPPYTVERVFASLTFDRPVLVEPMPGTDWLCVGQLAGKIVAFHDDPAQAKGTELLVDLAKARPALTALYGLAFHPRFTANRFVYICYVMQNDMPDGSRVSRFTLSSTSPPRIDPASEQILLTFRSGGHNGGALAFGKDGTLFISTGDGAGPSPPDPLDTGQDLSDFLSSILRIDVDHPDPGKPYGIPADNPFRDREGIRPEIWAYGLRNPWKMSVDTASGDLWVGDVGWELWELVHRVERGGNYGWSVVEGRQPVHPDGRRGPTPVLPPLIDHPHSEAASITGGYVYHGDRLKDLAGAYIYGDFQSGTVWGARLTDGKLSWHQVLAQTGLRLVSFGQDRHGELLLVEHERTNGLYRLVPNPVQQSSAAFPRTLGETGLFASVRDHEPAPGVIPFRINAEAWSDGAVAERLMALPGTAPIAIGPEGRWKPPEGAVLARTVSVDLRAGDPSSRRRVETQILHLEEGSWRPYTYAWNEEQTDATLVDAKGAVRNLAVTDAHEPGGRYTLAYRLAARSECGLCHNPWNESPANLFGRQSASPLAFNTAQLEHPVEGRSQVEHLVKLGVLASASPAGPRLADPYGEGGTPEARARAYLQVNCAHCHQENAGGATTIVLSANRPPNQMRAVDVAPAQGGFGIDQARIVAPGRPERSVLCYRVTKTGTGHMPRLGSQRVDERGARLLADWIAGLAPERALPESASLAVLRDPASPAPARRKALEDMVQSPERTLRLVQSILRDDVPTGVRDELANLAQQPLRPEVLDLIERFQPEERRVKRLGESFDPATIVSLPGDVRRGREVFFSESATSCRSCHRVAGEGTELGPDLSGIGTKYPSKADLLRHILEPSLQIDPQFATYQLATQDGQVLTGRLVERNAREVVLKDSQNRTIRTPAGEVEQLATIPRSLMPEQLLRDLTAQQAADLLEFLASLRTR